MIKVELEPKWNKQVCDDLLHIRIRTIFFFVSLVNSSNKTSGALGQRARHGCSFLSSLLQAIIQEGGFKTQPSCADGVTAGGTG